MKMDLGLKGRVAVITGPAKGMGAAVSKAFASEGCKLALIGRDVKAIEPVAGEIKASGGEAIIVPCDVTSTKACDDAAKAAQEKFGGTVVGSLTPYFMPSVTSNKSSPDARSASRKTR